MSTLQPTLDEIWKLFRETDRKFQETDRKFQETAERLTKELSDGRRESERRTQEIDRQLAEANKIIGRLGNRLGDFIEDAVRPAAVRLFRERGVDVHEVHQNVSAQRGGEGIEIDLLVVNDTDVVAIECKSNLSLDDVKEHLERLEKLQRMLPKYAASRVMGAVAAMVIPDNVAKYAYRQGLFVIGQSGEHLEIRNDPDFKPKFW